jgi:hypothetical protein
MEDGDGVTEEVRDVECSLGVVATRLDASHGLGVPASSAYAIGVLRKRRPPWHRH